MTRDDPLFRAARQVHRLLARQSGCEPDPFARAAARLADAQLAAGLVWRRIEAARRRGWHLAAHALRTEMLATARSLHAEVSRFLVVDDARVVRESAAQRTLRSLVDELRQLREEFDHVEILPDKGLVVARTDRVLLEDVDLGPFAIELHVRRLGDRADAGCFDCVALDPNPASASRETTHPHVQSNALCAGDAAAPISQALRQGRIADAFCLVRSVLQTYNPHSPYVALDAWSGSPCPDCGRPVGGGDLYYCEACGHDYCDACIGRCDVCDESACEGCLERDRVSRRDCCPTCRHTCGACHRTVDTDAFDDETGLCPQCAPAEPEEEEDEHDNEDTEEERPPQSQPPTTETADHEQPEPRPERAPQPQSAVATATST